MSVHGVFVYVIWMIKLGIQVAFWGKTPLNLLVQSLFLCKRKVCTAVL